MNKDWAHVSDFVFEILKFKCFLKSIITIEKLNASIIFNVVEYGVFFVKMKLKTRNGKFLTWHPELMLPFSASKFWDSKIRNCDIFRKSPKSIQKQSGGSLELQNMILDEIWALESWTYHQKLKSEISSKLIEKSISEPPGHLKIIKFSMLTHVLGGSRGPPTPTS